MGDFKVIHYNNPFREKDENTGKMSIDQTKQISGRELSSAKTRDINYDNGLSIFELYTLDKNQDGVVTEDEFKNNVDDTKYGVNELWERYFGEYQDMDMYDDLGEEMKGSDFYGEEFNDQGYMTNYKIKDRPDNFNPTAPNTTSVETADSSGSTGSTKSTSHVTTKEKDGATVAVADKTSGSGKTTISSKNNQIKKVTNKNSNLDLSKMSYDKDAKLTSIVIDGVKYDSKSIKVNKKGNTVITKEDGTKVRINKKNDKGETRIYNIGKDGKKESSICISKDNTPKWTASYNKEGRIGTKYFCNENKARIYKRNSAGDKKLESAVDYQCENNKVKNKNTPLAEREYSWCKETGKNYASSVVNLDKDGKTTGTVEKKKTYSNGYVTTTKITYDAEGKQTDKKVTKEKVDTKK